MNPHFIFNSLQSI
ncbi:MAG: histidine kinase [Bacteroidetes bacterium]|nr:histidine kinase [Bacteroidota bacterium]